MAKKLRTDDIIEKGLFSSTIEETNKFIDIVRTLKSEVKGLGDSLEKSIGKNSPIKGAEDVKKLNSELGQLKDTTKSLSNLEKEEARLKQRLNDLTKEQAFSNQSLKRQTKEQTQALRDLEVLQNKEAGTLERLAAESRTLRREREKLNLDTQKGRDRLKEINAQLDRNNAKVKANSDALKQQKLNVGNYTASVKGALTTSGLFSRQLVILERIQATLSILLKKNTAETAANTVAKEANVTATAANAAANSANAASINASTKATGGLSRALKVLKIALISTGIGAIVVALGTLITALVSTQRGADALSSVLKPLSVIFQRLFGFIQDVGLGVFDSLKSAIKDPIQGIKDLGNALKENLLNRFKALGVLGGAISKIFSGEFSEGFKDLGNGVIQLSTGVENAVEKMANAASDLGDEISKSIEQGKQLDELIKEFERKQIDTTIPLAKQRLEFQRLRAIANDQTKTDAERIKALLEAEKIQRKISSTEINLLDLQIKRMALEQSFNDTSRDEELELAKLKAKRLEQEAAAQKKINSLIALRTGLQKKLNSEFDKSLDLIEKELIAELEKEEKIKKKKEEAQKEEKERIKQSSIELAEEMKKRLEIVTSSINEQIKQSEKREDQLLKAAERGNLLAEESIAAEKARQDKLIAQKEASLKKQKQLEVAIAAINAYGNKSKNGDANALTKTVAEITTLLSIVGNLQAFEKGGLVEGGEQLVRINEKGQEYVISHGAVNKYGTEMLDAINKGDFSQMEIVRGSGGSISDFNVMMSQAMEKVSQEFRKAVSNIPQQRWSMSEITGGLKEEIEKSNQLKSRHYRKGKRLN